MSAWIVSKAHVDAIVQTAIVEGEIEVDKATETGRMLWLENHRSIEARYGEVVPMRVIAGYVFEGIEAPLDDVAILKNLGCFDYQSCEHGGWRTSEACALIQRLEAKLEARLGITEGSPRGPEIVARADAAPWGIDSLEQVVARRPS